MKNWIGLAVLGAALAAVGCTQERDYRADHTPPLATGGPARTADPAAQAAPTPTDFKKRVSANDDINSDNVDEKARQLEAELLAEKRAMSKAGK